MNVSPSYVAPIIPPISHHGWFQILVLAHTHCVVSQYKSSQRHPSTFTNPSQNDCLIILDTPSIPPISPHRSTQILALAHSFSLPFKYKSSQRHPSKSTKPSQNDCLIILDTPSIPPIRCHRPTQILALAHPFSLPNKVKSSQRHPSKSTKPSQNDCLIILDTPSIPPIRCHRPTQILALAHPFSLPFKYKSSQRHPSKEYKPISKWLSHHSRHPKYPTHFTSCPMKRHSSNPQIPPLHPPPLHSPTSHPIRSTLHYANTTPSIFLSRDKHMCEG